MNNYILEALNITKEFPGVIANKNVDLRIKPGEIHGLIGENGAGKSTLLKVLNGIYPHTDYTGEIIIEGQSVEMKTPHDAKKFGVGFVPQEINVLESLSVGENMYMGMWDEWNDGKSFRLGLDFKHIYEKSLEFLTGNNITLDPRRKVNLLNVGQKQLLMVARALVTNPKVLILDEPTTSLTQDEVLNLFRIVTALKEKGTSIIFVTHKLEEIMKITDSVTILRDGKNISTYEKSEYKEELIIADMVGRKITNLYPERMHEIGDEILRVEDLSVPHPRITGRMLINNVNFSLRRGEVLGIAGLMGAGRTEVLSAICGLLNGRTGRILKRDVPIEIKKMKDAIKHGFSLVTEDRKKTGLLFLNNIGFNLTINNLKTLGNLGILSRQKEKKHAGSYFTRMGVKAQGIETGVVALSGGNQQKVVIGKALNIEPEILLLDEPTKGVDVGSKFEIYNIINELSERGKSIIMVSSELPELIGMCDRFIVMANGAVAGEYTKADVDEHKIMQLATQSRQD